MNSYRLSQQGVRSLLLRIGPTSYILALLRRAVVAILMASVAFAAVAQRNTAPPQLLRTTVGELRVGVQVRIRDFTAADAARIRETGFQFVRFGVWTDSLGSDAYRRQVEAAFEYARSANLRVLMTVRPLRPFGKLSVDPMQHGDALSSVGAAFGREVAALEQAHASQLLAIELLNEPDLTKYWPSGQVEATLAPFMLAACAQWRALSTSVPILGLGFSRPPLNGSVPDVLLAQVLQRAPGCLGAVSYHAYGLSASQITAVSEDVKERYGLPVVITEWGVPSIPATGGNTGQAEQVSEFLKALPNTGMPIVSIYEWKDSASGSDQTQRNYGLVTVSGLAKPSLGVASAELPRVEGSVDPASRSSGSARQRRP
ncbi:hypothetical protein FPJ27_15070 [Burkholderia sp. MS455]|uniref:glycosyl hydrolase n=1 Tax=Burkholderia sp. MS455 TaxID=2811788 RepID=UPI00195E64C9|nr:glycosyl hydrolase [Burkholderia sp. MS455]QRR07601.1 hypothetical protein FPJ27_15070 [Burkholderia sp. MS455]